MLYLSRFSYTKETMLADVQAKLEGKHIGINEVRCGVVDTDDNTENFVSVAKLRDLVMRLGLNIQGSDPVCFRSTKDCVHQDSEYLTSLQLKYQSLGGVRITTWRGMITAIEYNLLSNRGPVEIRLSDICKSCSDYILLPIPITCSLPEQHIVTLVIDDSLDFSEHTFTSGVRLYKGIGVEGFGIKFDLRGLMSKDKAFDIYTNVVWSGSHVDSIIDSEDRKKVMFDSLLSMGYW